MGTDIQRTILWVFFGLSLFLLWDRWLVYNGRPAMFGTAPSQQTPQTVPPPATSAPPTAPAAPASSGVPQASPAAVPAPAASAPSTAPAPPTKPVVVQTDLLRVSIDPLGAVVSEVELMQQPVARDWTANGLIGLVTGRKQNTNETITLLDVSPTRVYVAQSGIIGGNFPNHRTPFKLIDGPSEVQLQPGQDRVEVRFAAESGGLRVIKTYTFHRGQYAADVSHQVVNTTSEP
ncbi:MAG: membrane protein insertase YidC, partial [Burkholderiaceae bacterium]